MEQKKEKLFYPVFNRKGRANYLLDKDKTHIYSWEGKSAAFVDKGGVWSYDKTLLGFFDQGWFRDKSGKCVGFSEPGRGGPNLPRERPPHEPPAQRGDPPEMPQIDEHPGRAPVRPLWSELSDKEFFEPPKKKKKPEKKAARKAGPKKAAKKSVKKAPKKAAKKSGSKKAAKKTAKKSSGKKK